MSQLFYVRLDNQDSGETAEVHGEFTDAEWETLKLFSSCARQLVEWGPAWNRSRVSYRFTWKEGEGARLHTDKTLTSDELAAFLHRMRPFILEKEATFFHSVGKILSRHLTHPVAQTILGWQRELFSGRDARRQVTIELDGVVLNSEELLKKWLNAYEYHRDTDKRRELQKVESVLSKEGVRALFIDMLVAKANAIFQVRGIIRQMEENADRGITSRPASLLPPA